MSLEEVYGKRLESLTFNSKPIITALTVIADENKHTHSAEIYSAILRRLDQIHPADAMRLTILYLIDSIIKNIGEPYITLFTAEIPRIFNDTFSACQVDKIRMSMIKLLNTWRDPKLRFPASLFQVIDAHIRATPRPGAQPPVDRRRPMDPNFASGYRAPPVPAKVRNLFVVVFEFLVCRGLVWINLFLDSIHKVVMRTLRRLECLRLYQKFLFSHHSLARIHPINNLLRIHLCIQLNNHLRHQLFRNCLRSIQMFGFSL
jgi:hypothetical protein